MGGWIGTDDLCVGLDRSMDSVWDSERRCLQVSTYVRFFLADMTKHA